MKRGKRYQESLKLLNKGEAYEAKEAFENMVNNVYSIISYQITGETGSCDKSHCATCGGGCH